MSGVSPGYAKKLIRFVSEVPLFEISMPAPAE